MSGAFATLMIDEIANVGSHPSHAGRSRHDSMLSIQFRYNKSPLPIATERGSLKPGAFLPCELLVFISHAVSNVSVTSESLILRGFDDRCNRVVSPVSSEHAGIHLTDTCQLP